jgi:peptidoglycan/xylan/chitin deacetylase (PgdA/CDA1 family)
MLTASYAARAQTPSPDSTSAVILAYHKIGEDAHPDTNLRIDQFDSHLSAIKNGGYTVLPLSTILNKWANEMPLPDKAIAITFDGAYRSSYENAMKKLIDADIPFTIFYAADQADFQTEQTLNWSTLKQLSKNPRVELGILPADFGRHSAQEDIRTHLNRALQNHRDHFGENPAYFAYPFGEYNQTYINAVQNAGITAAFGLQSGTAYNSGENLFSLPRFSMTELYGSAERFNLIAQALPIPATQIMPATSLQKDTVEMIGFTLPRDQGDSLTSMSCFISGQEKPDIQIINARVEIRPLSPITENRTRINCTIPVKTSPTDTRWRWFGMLLSFEE